MTTSSTELARSLLLALVEAGVREVVLSPGSRNAPLAFAAYDAAAVGLVRLHTRLDERTAGFLALGLTKVGSRAAVVCTSGTAVANLHPAVLEAAHAGVPLVVLTADRPPRLRGTSANQTTDQVGIFGALVATVDLSSGEPPAGTWSVVGSFVGWDKARAQAMTRVVGTDLFVLDLRIPRGTAHTYKLLSGTADTGFREDLTARNVVWDGINKQTVGEMNGIVHARIRQAVAKK